MKRLVEILQEIRPEFDFTAADNFVEKEMLNSLDIIALISTLEEEYGISIDGADIVPENFNGLEAIKTLVEKSGGTI